MMGPRLISTKGEGRAPKGRGMSGETACEATYRGGAGFTKGRGRHFPVLAKTRIFV